MLKLKETMTFYDRYPGEKSHERRNRWAVETLGSDQGGRDSL